MAVLAIGLNVFAMSESVVRLTAKGGSPFMPVELSVVVPVYRSEGSLRELHRRLVDVLDGLVSSFEVVLVEDGGGDRSWHVISELAAADERVVGVRLGRNYGQHNALLCGIRFAKGELIVTLDDDLQNPPEEIPSLVAELSKGFDVVYGTPTQVAHGVLRALASQVTKLALQESMGVASASKVSAFRIFRSRLRDAFENYRSPTVNIDVLLTWGTTRFSSVPVRLDERTVGDSGYTVRKLVTHALNMVTGFSVLPLQIASVLGLLFGALGGLLLAYVVVRFLIHGSSVPGFSFLASIIAIFSGVQLFALGVFGEYLARMHFRSMERPPYILLERTAAREV
jgi:undecaprenyl-phosphate 4-deoxy-4-formamido-L-arabinose transferase